MVLELLLCGCLASPMFVGWIPRPVGSFGVGKVLPGSLNDWVSCSNSQNTCFACAWRAWFTNVVVSSRRNAHFHTSARTPDLVPLRRPSDRTGRFGCETKVGETQGPFDKHVSGLRLPRQDSTCAFSSGRGSNNWPQASQTTPF